MLMDTVDRAKMFSDMAVMLARMVEVSADMAGWVVVAGIVSRVEPLIFREVLGRGISVIALGPVDQSSVGVGQALMDIGDDIAN
jgi:hypothetical protein